MPHIEFKFPPLPFFYTRIDDLSFIPPFKVESLHFCFDSLTDLPILAEWVPVSKELEKGILITFQMLPTLPERILSGEKVYCGACL